jgi:signal transduction histidine kinase
MCSIRATRTGRAGRPRHRGLGNIADRTRAIGGALQLTSAAGSGTTVCVDVRLEREQAHV